MLTMASIDRFEIPPGNRSIRPVDYNVDTDRILGNTSNEKGIPHCRFHLFVRWPPQAKRRQNPFTYRGDHWPDAIEPHQLLQSCLRNFQRNYMKDSWLMAELNDTLYYKGDERRNVLKYVNGVMEENRLHNYQMMIQGFHLIELLQF